MASKSFTRSLTKSLLNHFKSKMPSIKKAYDEFPNAVQKLEFPSFSIFIQQPKFTPCSPRDIFVGPKFTTGPNINKSLIQTVVGKYDFEMQIDFWCENKFQRHDIYEEFINSLNLNQSSSGFVLELTDYYNEKTNIDASEVLFMDDDEESSQRSQWRFKVKIFGNSRCIREKLEYVMANIEIVTETQGN